MNKKLNALIDRSQIKKTNLPTKFHFTYIAFNILLPIIIGIIIYIYFRKINPKILNYALLFVNLNQSPVYYFGGESYVPNWFVYNLPDALWAYSMTCFVVLIGIKDNLNNRLFYYIISYILILGQEILQGSLLQGTYDFYDILAINLGFFLGLYTSTTLGAHRDDC